MSEVYLATGNAHKVSEIQKLSAWHQLCWQVWGADRVAGMPEVDENADSFAGNALLKARALRERVPAGAWVLADDSGLAVDGLKGAPGVYSARYAGAGATDADNLQLVLRNMAAKKDLKERRAHFVCVLALIGPDGREWSFEGRCSGHLLDAPRGSHGFGYDPIFQPDGHSGSFAELGPEVKDHLSHRAKAFQALAETLGLVV